MILQKKKKTRGGFIGQIRNPAKTPQQEWQAAKAPKAEDAAQLVQAAEEKVNESLQNVAVAVAKNKTTTPETVVSLADAVAVSNAMNSNSNKKKKYITTLESIQRQIGNLITQTKTM